MRTNLDVPPAQRAMAKDLGARFDMSAKCWYVPDGVDLTPFLRWVPNMPTLSKAVKKVLRKR